MKKWSRSLGVKEIKLSSGATATIVEPRDYSIGRFLIVGENGSIADYPLQNVENSYHIDYQIYEGAYQNLLVKGEMASCDLDNYCYSNSCSSTVLGELDEKYRENLPCNLVETNLMTTMKIRGFMELLSKFGDRCSPYQYDPIEGLYDAGVIVFLEKFGYFFDRRVLGQSLFARLLAFASKMSKSLVRH